MNSFRVWFVSLFILVWLASCRQVGKTPEISSAPVGNQTPVLTAPSTPTRTATPTWVPPTVTPTWTPGITSTGFITAFPTITTTITAAGTLDLTPGAEITSTPGVSQTIAITATTILTKTWTFTDVLVTNSGAIRQVAWNQDGGQFAAATSVGLFLYSADLLEVERSFSIGESFQCVDFSLGEGLLVSGGLKGDIQWWVPDTGRYAGAFNGGLLGITSLAFPPQGDTMVSGSDDGTIRVWVPSQILDPAITEYEPLNVWHAPDRVTSVDINPNLQIAAAGSYQEVSIWNLGTGEPIQTLGELSGWVREIAISPNGGYLAVADSSNHLRLWSTGNWALTHDIPLDGFESITALDFSPNSLMIALGGKNGKVVVWNLANNTLHDPQTRYPYPVTDVAFHPQENILISSYRDGLVRLWSYQP
jgi:WD40 repeat protein